MPAVADSFEIPHRRTDGIQIGGSNKQPPYSLRFGRNLLDQLAINHFDENVLQ
ncbi:MAG: hypothetical protein ACMUIM_00770 [bacterium]